MSEKERDIEEEGEEGGLSVCGDGGLVSSCCCCQ